MAAPVLAQLDSVGPFVAELAGPTAPTENLLSPFGFQLLVLNLCIVVALKAAGAFASSGYRITASFLLVASTWAILIPYYHFEQELGMNPPGEILSAIGGLLLVIVGRFIRREAEFRKSPSLTVGPSSLAAVAGVAVLFASIPAALDVTEVVFKSSQAMAVTLAFSLVLMTLGLVSVCDGVYTLSKEILDEAWPWRAVWTICILHWGFEFAFTLRTLETLNGGFPTEMPAVFSYSFAVTKLILTILLTLVLGRVPKSGETDARSAWQSARHLVIHLFG